MPKDDANASNQEKAEAITEQLEHLEFLSKSRPQSAFHVQYDKALSPKRLTASSPTVAEEHFNKIETATPNVIPILIQPDFDAAIPSISIVETSTPTKSISRQHSFSGSSNQPASDLLQRASRQNSFSGMPTSGTLSTKASIVHLNASQSLSRAGSVIETTDMKVSTDTEGHRHLNQYVLIRALGAGAFGTVHLAQSTQSDKYFAVKELSKSRLQQMAMKKRGPMGAFPGRGRGRGGGPGAASGGQTHSSNATEDPTQDPLYPIRREIAILKKIRHPHCVRLYEVLDDSRVDALFMVLEYCSGGVLMNMSMTETQTPYSENDSRHFFRQLLLAIEYLHANDIAHRDIKPENIMKTGSDGRTIRVVDFGVSELFTPLDDGLPASKRLSSTTAFLAPELCDGSSTKTSAKAADLWAMGVTLFALVTGRLPFTGEHRVALHEAICAASPHYPDNLSPELVQCLKRLLDRDLNIRASFHYLREDKWISFQQPDLPPVSQNCGTRLVVTEAEIRQATRTIGGLMHVIRAAGRFKTALHKKTS